MNPSNIKKYEEKIECNHEFVSYLITNLKHNMYDKETSFKYCKYCGIMQLIKPKNNENT